LGVGVFCALTTGCASIDPYPKSQEYWAYHDKVNDKSGGTPAFQCPSAASGKEMAYCERFEYERRLRQLGVTNSLNAIGLLTLAGIIAYKGPNVEGSQKNVQALTLGGTAWYAGYSYLYKKPREAIYAGGILALDCAMEQASPWIDAKSPSLDNALPRLDSSVQRSVVKVVAAESAVDDLEQCDLDEHQQAKFDELKARAGSLRTQLDADKADLAHGLRFDREYRQNTANADRQLGFAVRAIHNELISQLQKMQPDPLALAGSLAPFAPGSKSAPPAPGKAEPTPAKAHEKGCNAADRINQATTLVEEAETFRSGRNPNEAFDFDALDIVKDALASDPGSPATSSGYHECAALAVAGGGPLQLVQQATEPLPLKKGESLQVAFTGGVPPYKATLVGSTTHLDLVISTSPSGLGYVLYVTSGKDTASGKQVILLTDASGATRVIEVKIND